MTMLCSPIMLAYLAFAAAAAAADLAGALLVTTAHQKGLAPLRYFVAGGAGFLLAAALLRVLPARAPGPHPLPFVPVRHLRGPPLRPPGGPPLHLPQDVPPPAPLPPS